MHRIFDHWECQDVEQGRALEQLDCSAVLDGSIDRVDPNTLRPQSLPPSPVYQTDEQQANSSWRLSERCRR